MSALSKSGKPSPATTNFGYEHKHALIAGEAIAQGDACYIKSDGKAWLATGAAANAAAVVDGFAMSDCVAGDAVTLVFGITINYGSGMTPGTAYYLSGTTAGGLDTATSTGGTVVVARAVDATRLYVRKSY